MPERTLRPAALALLLWVPAAALAAWQMGGQVRPGLWWPTLLWPDPANIQQVIAVAATLPRIAMAAAAGMALGLAGALLQQALRNPIAAPDTLGISATAQFGLAAATLYAPSLLAGIGREAVASVAGFAGVAAVLALTWRGGLRPAAVVLAGLAVGLYAGSLATALALLHGRLLAGLFLWAGGDLAQSGWSNPVRMLLCLAAGLVATALLARPLRMLDLPDDAARAAGAPVAVIRGVALAVAVALAGAVSALVGTIGFVGLAAPLLARRAATNTQRLLWASALGGGLLLLVDQLVQRSTQAWAEPPPTGAITALLGAPLLLWLLLHMPDDARTADPQPGGRRGWQPIAAAAALLALAAAGALYLAPNFAGWQWGGAALPLRAPRIAAAAIGGAASGIAGSILQRILANPAASPEVLGLSTGAMLGLVATMLLGIDDAALRLLAAAAGAAAVLFCILVYSRFGADPGRMLLAGVALAAAFGAMLALFLATGDPRGEAVLSAVSGSTYGVSPATVAQAAAAAALLVAFVIPCLRWLELLALGDPLARALGVTPERVRTAMLVHVAGLTAVATVLTGPLSFVGLMAPHLARMAGLARAGRQLAGAAIFGALLMVAADWVARTLLFPAELPAGLVAGVIGAPVLLYALAATR